MANLTFSVIARSCSIGKIYWKSVALPTIFYGSNIMDFNKQEIEKLQKIENSVGRQIMGVPRYTQGSALRGEIGMFSMRARIMEGQIKYLEYCMKDEGNELLGRIAEVKVNGSRMC